MKKQLLLSLLLFTSVIAVSAQQPKGKWSTGIGMAVQGFEFFSNDSLFFRFDGDLSQSMRRGHYKMKQDSIFIQYIAPSPAEQALMHGRSYGSNSDTLLIKNFHLMTRKNGLAFYPIALAFKREFNLKDTVFKPNQVLRSYAIHYELSKATLQKESFPFLDSLAALLLKHPGLEIEVSNHTDSRSAASQSSRSSNLTQGRAFAIQNYLAKKGVAMIRIKAVGMGASKLLISDPEIKRLKNVQEIEAAHAKNRRTEFKILSIQFKPPYTEKGTKPEPHEKTDQQH